MLEFPFVFFDSSGYISFVYRMYCTTVGHFKVQLCEYSHDEKMILVRKQLYQNGEIRVMHQVSFDVNENFDRVIYTFYREKSF